MFPLRSSSLFSASPQGPVRRNESHAVISGERSSSGRTERHKPERPEHSTPARPEHSTSERSCCCSSCCSNGSRGGRGSAWACRNGGISEHSTSERSCCCSRCSQRERSSWERKRPERTPRERHTPERTRPEPHTPERTPRERHTPEHNHCCSCSSGSSYAARSRTARERNSCLRDRTNRHPQRWHTASGRRSKSSTSLSTSPGKMFWSGAKAIVSNGRVRSGHPRPCCGSQPLWIAVWESPLIFSTAFFADIDAKRASGATGSPPGRVVPDTPATPVPELRDI